jgi:RNA polymerase sigma-70 factor, ECF subfamily
VVIIPTGGYVAVAGKDHTVQFQALLLPELGYLRRVGLALTGSQAAADDLVQETVLRALRYFGSYKGDGFKPWMAAIMRNVYRDRPMTTPVTTDDKWLQSIADSAPDPEQQALAKDNSTRLRGLIAALPEALREILVMREFAELSYAQISTALDIPVGTVMSRLSRARDDLRTAWLAGEDKAAS